VDTPGSPADRTVPWLVFDGDCGFCTTSAQWVARRLAHPGRADALLVPWQFTDLAALGTTQDRAEQEVLWVAPDGTVLGGAQAFAAWLRFAGRPHVVLGTVMTWPGVRQLAAAVYRLVAANRQRLPGGTPACALPPTRTSSA
jgi:predicted DCC family thiol-disulfide oxidoreductase YuxK